MGGAGCAGHSRSTAWQALRRRVYGAPFYSGLIDAAFLNPRVEEAEVDLVGLVEATGLTGSELYVERNNSAARRQFRHQESVPCRRSLSGATLDPSGRSPEGFREGPQMTSLMARRA